MSQDLLGQTEEKHKEISLKVIGVLAKIQTGHLPSTRQVLSLRPTCLISFCKQEYQC